MRIRANHEKRGVVSIGLRVGYWYCIPSVFVQVNVWTWYWSFWVESGEHRWTPAELSADRRVEPKDEWIEGLEHEWRCWREDGSYGPPCTSVETRNNHTWSGRHWNCTEIAFTEVP